MRTIIAGSRTATHYKDLLDFMLSRKIPFSPTVIISGTARGADRLGERFAKKNNIPLEQYPADWQKYGKGAGMIRNKEMLDVAEALIVLWDGKSRGTLHILTKAQKMGLKVFVKRIKPCSIKDCKLCR